MNSRLLILISAVVALLGISANAQPQINRDKIIEDVEKSGCVVTEDDKVKICKFDYRYKNQTVEALTFRPIAQGKFPGLMLIPGYQGTVKSYLSFGIIFAKLGFASMTLSTPGFGKTGLKPDFLGKSTIKAYVEGYEKFRQESFVDKDKLGIFGYSRGAIAASLMITELKDVKAAVLGGGIYDLKKAYDELTIEGIKENIKAEMGASENAFKERSAIRRAKKINCPVLIIHGEKDQNAPTNQAYLLRDELKRLNKDFELQIIAGQDHRIGGGSFLQLIVDFFSRKLLGKASTVKIS
jgi:dipeptidyl aminopeptidase/acylaminoacyl peptidase